MFEIKSLKPNDKGLNEMGQHLAIKFAFATYDKKNNIVTRLHEMCQCRDYLGDVIWANKYGVISNIYGMVVDPKVQITNKQKTQLLLLFPTMVHKKLFLENYENILHPLEKAYKLKPTNIVDKEESSYLLVIADKFWQDAVFLISFYSFMLKACAYEYKNIADWPKELANQNTVEGSYMGQSLPMWDKIVNNLRKVREAFPDKIAGIENEEQSGRVGSIHNYSGFLAVFAKNEAYKNTNVFARFFGEKVCAA